MGKNYDERRNVLSNDELRTILNKSTKVVNWYVHSNTVRGPFGRWFTVSERLENWKAGDLAYHTDDVAFASAAMNNLEQLLDKSESLEKAKQCLEECSDIFGVMQNKEAHQEMVETVLNEISK